MDENLSKLGVELLPLILGSGIAMVIFFVALVVSYLSSEKSDVAGCLGLLFLVLTAGAAVIFFAATIVFVAAGGWGFLQSLGPIQVEVHVK